MAEKLPQQSAINQLFIKQDRSPELDRWTFIELQTKLRALTSEQGMPLKFAEAGPFIDEVLQHEDEDENIVDEVEEDQIIGNVCNFSDTLGTIPDRIDVVTLNPVGRGIATSLAADQRAVSRSDYIAFSKYDSNTRANLTGIVWFNTVAGEMSIEAAGEVILTDDHDTGFEMLQFADHIGLGRVWRSAVTEQQPGKRYDFMITYNKPMTNSLFNGVVDLIDLQAGRQ